MIGSSADQVEYWRAEARKLATLLMSSYVWVHEYKSAEVDEALEPYIGTYDQKQHRIGSINATETENPNDRTGFKSVLQESRKGVRWEGPA